MESWDIFFRILSLIGTIVTGTLAIYLPFRLKLMEIKQKKEAEEKAKTQEESAKQRADDLDKKLAVRLQVVIDDQENHTKLLNEVNDKVEKTAKLLTEHIKEGSLKTNFSNVFWYQVNQITHFWNSRDEKFKVIFDYWTDSIEALAGAYIDNKTKKSKHPYDEFHPTEMMERMIIDFNKRADSLIESTINNITFSKWLEGKNIHGKSRVIANELEANGMNEEQFIGKMKNYIFNFGTLYTTACDLWTIEVEKKKVA